MVVPLPPICVALNPPGSVWLKMFICVPFFELTIEIGRTIICCDEDDEDAEEICFAVWGGKVVIAKIF